MAEYVGEGGEGLRVVDPRVLLREAPCGIGVGGFGQAPQAGPDALRAAAFEQYATLVVAQDQQSTLVPA